MQILLKKYAITGVANTAKIIIAETVRRKGLGINPSLLYNFGTNAHAISPHKTEMIKDVLKSIVGIVNAHITITAEIASGK